MESDDNKFEGPGDQLPGQPDGTPEELKRRKIIFGSILGIGVAALAFGVVAFFQGLKSPFLPPVANQTNTQVAETNTASLESLKTKDTDGDGLSDYDELYVYHTSPYLADSDSDGISDKDEIARGTDPNCPEGKTCRQPVNTANSNAQTNSGNVNQTAVTDTVPLDTLRKALKDAGAPQTVIDNLTDADLLNLYSQTVAESNTTNANAATNTSASNLAANSSLFANTSFTNTASTNAGTNSAEANFYASLSNLSPSEIRTFLVQSGVDQTTLNGMDDATLKLVFQQALQQASQ